MIAIGQDSAPGLRLPDLNCFIITSRGNVHTIRRPRNSSHSAWVAAISEYLFSRGCIPYLYYTIHTSRGNKLSIGRPGDSSHPNPPTRMDARGKDLTISGRIPHLHSLIIASRGNVLPIW